MTFQNENTNADAPAIQYGFYGRLSEPFPSQIIVDVTEVCNLACVHCPHPDFKKSKHYAARYLEVELNNRMVDEVRAHSQGSAKYIRYTSNGEPLVHPKIYDMLDYAVKNSGVAVVLTTNGTILNEKRVAKLFASGLHLIDVSIDAYNAETYAKIRVNGDLEVTRKNVNRMLEIKRSIGAATRIVVSFVEQPENAKEAASFEDYWKTQGADYVVVRRLHSNAGTVPAIAHMLRQQQVTEARRPCLYPWERIMLNARGELAFCPQDWVHGSVLADYRDTTILDVWRGEAYRKLREAHMKNNFRGHEFCGQCPDWKQTRWPEEGRSYADMVRDLVQPQ
jgi:MoaA/NifB/PqqE/SkfB family radical SAM enzyme